MTQTPYDHERFLDLAATQTITDAPTAACWQLVVEGIKHQFLGGLNLDKVTANLRRHAGYSLNELDFDWGTEDTAILDVTSFGNSASCSGSSLIAELDRLGRRYRGEPEPADLPPETDDSIAADLGPLLAKILFTPPTALAAQSPEEQRRATLARKSVSRLARELQSPDPHLRARTAAEVARLRESLAAVHDATVERIGEVQHSEAMLNDYDSSTLAETLRVLADFLEGRTAATGKQLDALVAVLDRSLGGTIGHDAAAAEATRDQRIRESARSSIAERLRQVGIDPAKEKK